MLYHLVHSMTEIVSDLTKAELEVATSFIKLLIMKIDSLHT